MPFIFTQNERVYVAEESGGYGIVPTFAAGNAVRHASFEASGVSEEIQRPDKTAVLSQILGVRGRRTASGNLSMSAAGSGTPGTVPEMNTLLKAAFGAAPTITGGTSVVYNLSDDTPISLSAASYRTPSTANHKILSGWIINEMEYSWGENIPMMRFSGPAKWPIDSATFASLETAGRGGLSSFPAEPASQTYIGTPPAGFTGSIQIGANTFNTALNGRIRLSLGNDLITLFNQYYQGAPGRGRRVCTFDFRVIEEDQANFNALLTAALSHTPVDITLVIGTVPGNIWTWLLKSVILPHPTVEETSTRYIASFSNCMAHSSNGVLRDEVRLTLT